jgi:hypothetical protein
VCATLASCRREPSPKVDDVGASACQVISGLPGEVVRVREAPLDVLGSMGGDSLDDRCLARCSTASARWA